MLMKPDCIPCILKMSTSAIRKLTSDEKIVKELLCQILEIPSRHILQIPYHFSITSPLLFAILKAGEAETLP